MNLEGKGLFWSHREHGRERRKDSSSVQLSVVRYVPPKVKKGMIREMSDWKKAMKEGDMGEMLTSSWRSESKGS